MSKIEVNQIDTISGSSTLLVGPSAATKLTFSSTLTVDFNVNSPGVTLNNTMKMTPSVFITSDGIAQTINSGVWTKVTIHNTEIWDTDNTWSSNKFTAGVAGKYYVKASIRQATDDFTSPYIMVLKNSSAINGSDGTTQQIYRQDVTTAGDTIAVSGAWNLSAADYLEVYFYHTTGSSKDIGGGGTASYSFFNAYRIIGA